MFKKNEINKNLVGAIQSHLDDQNISYDDLISAWPKYFIMTNMKTVNGNTIISIEKILSNDELKELEEKKEIIISCKYQKK